MVNGPAELNVLTYLSNRMVDSVGETDINFMPGNKVEVKNAGTFDEVCRALSVTKLYGGTTLSHDHTIPYGDSAQDWTFVLADGNQVERFRSRYGESYIIRRTKQQAA